MTTAQFFVNAKLSEDGFGDMKQSLFGYEDSTGYYLSDGLTKVVEVSYDFYRQVDVAFGTAYDQDLATTEELAELLEQVGLA